MSVDKEQRTGDSVAVRVADREEVVELNFVPQWARKGASDGMDLGRYDDRDSGAGGGAYRGRGRAPERGRPARGRDAGSGRDRRPRRDDARGGGARPRPAGDPERRSGGRGRSDTPDRGARVSSSRPPIREPLAPLPPVVVRFLPEQKQLAALVRQVTGARRAYPLIDLAHLLLEREGCCFVKVAPSREAPADLAFQVCKRCGYAALDAADVRAHVMSAHFDDVFDVEEVAVEPPSGNFVCVAKCGMSGEYLGPPNHHSYNERIREVHAARYANMPLEQYRSRIVLLHEPEAVEAWRAACSVQRRYRLKSEGGGEEAPIEEALTWAAAQAHMRDSVVPGSVTVAKKVVMGEAVARTVSDAGLRRAIREEWQSEMRFPVHLAFALRAAFRHRKLHTFKAGAGKGVNFVTGIEPHPISPDHTIDMIRQVLTLLHDSPGITRENVLEAVVPGAQKDSPEAREVLQAIHWLTEKGHIIEFFNGCLSVPLGKHAAGKAAPHLPGYKSRGKRS